MALLSPFVIKIINKSWQSNFESSVQGSIESVKNLYLNETTNPQSEVYLPLTVEFLEDSYKTYCGGNEIDLIYKLDAKGLKPISGKITWDENSNIIVENLKYKGYKYICNKEAQGQIECIKDSLK